MEQEYKNNSANGKVNVAVMCKTEELLTTVKLKEKSAKLAIFRVYATNLKAVISHNEEDFENISM